MQKKFSFERLLPRVPELTERDCGELATNNPPLPCNDLAHRLKAYWAAGMKQGQMAKITGCGKDYIKKFTACFSRALYMSPIGVQEVKKPKKEVQYQKINAEKVGRGKSIKSLIVNFKSTISKKKQREYTKKAIGEGLSVPENAKLIPLTKGYFAFVSDVDFLELSQYRWSAIVCNHTVYAMRYDAKNKKRVLMHRQILGLSDPKVLTDHKNGNGIDNRRENIRPCSAAENARNQRISKRNTSGFKGVSWKDKDLRWQAKIRVNRKYIHLGHFISVIEAAKAYNEAAIKYHGEFANINEV